MKGPSDVVFLEIVTLCFLLSFSLLIPVSVATENIALILLGASSGSCGGTGSCGSSGTSGGCGSSGSCGSAVSGCGGSGGCGTPGVKSSSVSSSSGTSGLVISENTRSPQYESTFVPSSQGVVAGCAPGANSGCNSAATGCGPPQESVRSDGSSSANLGAIPSSGFGLGSASFPEASVDLKIGVSNSNPNVGERVDISLATEAFEEFSNVRLEIILPKAVEHIRGDLVWEGSLHKSGKKELSVIVQTLKNGVWEIEGKMIAFEGDHNRIGKADHVYLLVGGEAPAELESMVKAITNPERAVIRIESSSVSEPSVAMPGTVTIKGHFGVYECRCDVTDDDDCYCSTCTGNNCPSYHFHGMPYMLVEAWDSDLLGDDYIGGTYTDTSGYFELLNINNDDGEGGTNEWYLKFILLGWPSFQSGYAWVQPYNLAKNWQNAYYGRWDIGNLAHGTVHDTGWIVFTDSRNANILYATMKECHWMYYHCFAWDMPNVCIFYPAPTSATATSLYEIYIAGPGYSAYDHAMDDDVVLHEYGHDVMQYFYGTMPQCTIATEGCSGTCTCTNHGGSSNHCSCDGIVEGWANFVAAVVPEEWNSRNWATDRYVVTKDGLVYRDHESNAIVHEYHEMTFARILWDILDPTSDGESVQVLFERGADWNDYSKNPIWFEMTRQYPGNEHSLAEEPYTLVEFWNFWLESFPYGDTTVGESDLCNIYSLHGVKRDFTNRCTNNCKCDGMCDACCGCGGIGCPISNYSCNCGGTKGVCSSSIIGCGGSGCGCSGSYCKNAPSTSFPCGEAKGSCSSSTIGCGGTGCGCTGTYCKNAASSAFPCSETKGSCSLSTIGCGGSGCGCTGSYCKNAGSSSFPCVEISGPCSNMGCAVGTHCGCSGTYCKLASSGSFPCNKNSGPCSSEGCTQTGCHCGGSYCATNPSNLPCNTGSCSSIGCKATGCSGDCTGNYCSTVYNSELPCQKTTGPCSSYGCSASGCSGGCSGTYCKNAAGSSFPCGESSGSCSSSQYGCGAGAYCTCTGTYCKNYPKSCNKGSCESYGCKANDSHGSCTCTALVCQTNPSKPCGGSTNCQGNCPDGAKCLCINLSYCNSNPCKNCGDNTPPTEPTNLAWTSPITDPTPSFSWTASTDNIAVKGYYVNITGYPTYYIGNVTIWESPDTISDCNHTFNVWATDTVGNNSTIASLNFTIDTTAPTVIIIAPTTTSPTYTQTPTTIYIAYNYTELHPKNVTIRIHNATHTIGQTTITTLAAGTNINRNDSVTIAAAADGAYNVSVTIYDIADHSTTDEKANAVIVARVRCIYFDFGTDVSPVEAGYARIDPSSIYSSSIGYGWEDVSGLYCRDRGSPDNLRRDFVFSSMARTFKVDLPNGIYEVELIVGDALFAHDQICIYAEGLLQANVSVKAGEFVRVAFQISISDAQLNLTFSDCGGADPNWVVNGLLIRQYTGRKFDFGAEDSPVVQGYTRVTLSTAYSPSLGYGWTSAGYLWSRDRSLPDDLRRDFVFSSGNATFRVDVLNGDYLVMVVVGDQSYPHDNILIYAEGVLKANISANVGEFIQKVFTVSVTNGTLGLTFSDGGGSDPNWVINAILIEQYVERKFDFGTDASPVESGYVQVTDATAYSLSLGYGWVSSSNLQARDRGTPDNLRRDFVFSASNKTFKVDFPNGKYRVLMMVGDNDYRHDRINIYCQGTLVANNLTVKKGYFAELAFLAEVSDGHLEITFVDGGGTDPNWIVNAIHIKTTFGLRMEFDFGTDSSPVEDGYARVTSTTAYSPCTCYGWSNVTNLQSRDRGAPDALRRDFIFSSSDHTFNVDLPNGKYQVTLIIGDQNYMHDKIDVYAEASLMVNDLTVPSGTFKEVTFTVTVNDGQLNITLHDNGGADPNWVINSMTIESYLQSTGST